MGPFHHHASGCWTAGSARQQTSKQETKKLTSQQSNKRTNKQTNKLPHLALLGQPTPTWRQINPILANLVTTWFQLGPPIRAYIYMYIYSTYPYIQYRVSSGLRRPGVPGSLTLVQ